MDTPDTYFELVVAYSAIWFCIVGFIVKLMIDQKKMSLELDKFKSVED